MSILIKKLNTSALLIMMELCFDNQPHCKLKMINNSSNFNSNSR